MLATEIAKLLGDIPSGYDAVGYVCSVLVLLWILDGFYGIARMLISRYMG